MAKVIQKKNHWITKVNECTLVPDASGELNVELLGGAENGEFPCVGHVREELVLFQDGKLCEGELLLEVDGLAVPGLPLYDIFALIKCCNGPVRMRTVRQVAAEPTLTSATEGSTLGTRAQSRGSFAVAEQLLLGMHH
ncbi:Membrane-associated guanylate kinase, WW and PDZ domain-containing protein 1 [Takifugu flavidus]|uniref:Membrane-associated guanylate kinase, WW and PDZ domain-containing protein 1 n=1 Tax=Takifugu flavidus TaxID=433684 RepID=A0A5C6MTL9_9TELE|nr:Membrane-associated guanylate kinase, WW and PDZ domain-containing protein 1 [Takifugu flavidus]